jgi:hypothetical protein
MKALASLETKIIHTTRSATAQLNLFTVAAPRTVSLEEDQALTHRDLLAELQSMQQKHATSHQALMHALGQLSAANAHCTAIHRELGGVREQLVNATRAKECGSKKIKAHFVTSRALRLEFDQEEVERQERERVATEKEKQKEVEDVLHARQIADNAINRDFTGRLASYKKDDLRALAIAISVSDKGTNAELTARILDQFEQNPDMKQNSRFSCLFNKRVAYRKGATVPSGKEGQGESSQPQSRSIAASSSSSHLSHPPYLPTASSSSHMIPPNYKYLPNNVDHSQLVAPVIPAHHDPSHDLGAHYNTTPRPHNFTYQPFYYYNTFQ